MAPTQEVQVLIELTKNCIGTQPVRHKGGKILWWSSVYTADLPLAPYVSLSAWCGNTSGPLPESSPPEWPGPHQVCGCHISVKNRRWVTFLPIQRKPTLVLWCYLNFKGGLGVEVGVVACWDECSSSLLWEGGNKSWLCLLKLVFLQEFYRRMRKLLSENHFWRQSEAFTWTFVCTYCTDMNVCHCHNQGSHPYLKNT